MITLKKTGLLITVLAGLFYIGFSGNDFYAQPDLPEYDGSPFLGSYMPELRDTLLLAADNFAVVNLKTQTATVYRRDSLPFIFPVSTGNKYVAGGMETTPGLFYIYYKIREWRSLQFDSTRMLYWMPFCFGIGFHGLGGSSYYKYLGERPSSHGCVRVSREDGEILFNMMNAGDPVLVTKGDHVFHFRFYENEKEIEELEPEYVLEEVKLRQKYLASGDYIRAFRYKLLITPENIPFQGLPLGDVNLISERQKLPGKYEETVTSVSDLTVTYYEYYFPPRKILPPVTSLISAGSLLASGDE